MVRPIRQSDYDNVRQLWRDAWLNSQKDIDLFFKNFPRPLAFVNEENSIITSFALFIESTYVIAGVESKVWMLYKCVTQTEFRRRGYMKAILTKVWQTAKENGCEGIVTIPPSDRISDYFKHCGFQLFTKKKVVVMEYSKLNVDLQIAKLSWHQLQTARRRVFGTNTLIWPNHYANLVVQQLAEREVGCYSFTYFNTIGTMICYKKDSVLIVEELTLKMLHRGRVREINMQDVTNGLCSALDVMTVCYSLPENSDVLGKPIESALIMSDTLQYSPEKYVYWF